MMEDNFRASDLAEDPLKREARTYELPSVPDESATLAKATFVFAGLSGVYSWSAFMTISLLISQVFFEIDVMSRTLLLAYFTPVLLCSIWIVCLRRVAARNVFIAYIAVAAATAGTPLCLTYSSGKLGIIFIHIAAGVIGTASSILAVNFISFASLMKKSLVGFQIAGNGLAGCIVFLQWQVLSNFFFDITIKADALKAIWFLFMGLFPIAMIASILFYKLSRESWFVKGQLDFKEGVKDPAWRKLTRQPPANHPYEQLVRSSGEILQQSLPHLVLGSVSFFVTYVLFPTIGPYRFRGAGVKQSSTLVGVFQAFDFTFRMLPNLSSNFVMSSVQLKRFVYQRLIFIPIFVLMCFVSIPFTTSAVTHWAVIIAFGICSGLANTQSMVGVSQNARPNLEKGICGLYGHIALQIGIASALLVSTFLQFLVDLALK